MCHDAMVKCCIIMYNIYIYINIYIYNWAMIGDYDHPQNNNVIYTHTPRLGIIGDGHITMVSGNIRTARYRQAK